MRLLLLLTAWICTPIVLLAQDWIAPLDSTLQQLAGDSLFDGQILIAEQGQVLFHQAYGEHETHPERPAIALTDPFLVYSVGKSMTACAILKLVERGHLSLSDEMTDFWPDFPYRGVTVRHLLTMTSGLPRFLPTALEHGDTTQWLGNDAIIDLIITHQPSAVEPGYDFAYNNGNYVLLGSIIEKVSGQSFAAFMKAVVFDPIGMTHTYESISHHTDHRMEKGITADNFYHVYGAGSIVTTAYDLFLYDRALSNGFLPDSLLREAFQGVQLENGHYSNYGFGWRVDSSDSGKEVYHVGDGKGMRASLQRFLDQDRTLIYIHPYSNAYSNDVYWVVRNSWEGKAFDLPKLHKKHTLSPAQLEKYVGSYKTGFGLVHVTAVDGKLYLRPDPIEGKEELVPSSDTTFYFAGQNIAWEFFLHEDGSVKGFGFKGQPESMGEKQ